jgi:plasmid stability protein
MGIATLLFPGTERDSLDPPAPVSLDWGLASAVYYYRLYTKATGRTMATNQGSDRRKIHVDLPAELHKKLRVRAALEGLSIQAFVTRLVANAVGNMKLPEGGKGRGKGADHGRR